MNNGFDEDSFIAGINGQVIKAKGRAPFKMLEAVRVGVQGLIGEVIKVNADVATIQVYEVTTGLMVGEPVLPTGKPLSITLAPGILGNFFDGIERPLSALEVASGDFIIRGANVPNLDENKKWTVKIIAKAGEFASEGDIIAEYKVNGIGPLLMLELMHMIKDNTVIKRCKLCGLYFEVNNLNERYCDRV